MSEAYTTFFCKTCHTEIQASLDMVGQQAECPTCGTKTTIPAAADDGVKRHELGDTDPDTVQAMKSRTIRIVLEDF